MTADERDILALRTLAKQTKASFLPLPAGSSSSGGKGQGRVLTAVELRSLALLSYFRTPSACSRYPTDPANARRIRSGHSLSQWLPPTDTTTHHSQHTNGVQQPEPQRPLIDRMPYAIRWCNVRIGFTHDRPPNSQALVALNGSLVALIIDPSQYMPGPGAAPAAAAPAGAGGGGGQAALPPPGQQAVQQAAQAASAAGFPGILAQAPAATAGAHCVGLGIVSRIDPRTQEIFVVTPVPHAAVSPTSGSY